MKEKVMKFPKITNKKIQTSPFVFLILSTLTSWLLMHLLFSDLFLKQSVSFMKFAETEYNYIGVFTLLSNFYHGGIQLWNNYDQMPLAYYYLTGGMTYFSNLITAIIYILFSPLFHSPAVAFHSLFSRFYYLPTIFLINSGTYLLIRRYSRNYLVLFITVLLSSTFLIPEIYLGLYVGNLFAFFPLLIHFILRFYETVRLPYLLLAVVTFTISCATNPLIGLGYYYLGVHFFIFAALLWFLFTSRFKAFNKIKNVLRWKNIKITISIFGLCVLVMLPWIYLLATNYKDYDLAHEKSRFTNIQILNPLQYFQRPSFYAPQSEFLFRMVKFEDNDFAFSWVYIGVTCVFLTVCGIVLGTNRQKFIYLTTIVCFWLINSPRNSTSFSTPIHWFNAFTNPFNFVPRSFHMTGAYLLGFVLAPLMAMGLDRLITTNEFTWRKLTFILFGLLVILNPLSSSWSTNMHKYTIVSFCICVCLLLLGKFIFPNGRKMNFLLAGLFSLLILDGFGMAYYLRQVSKRLEIVPQANSKSSPLVIDFQNPHILPLRTYYNNQPLKEVSHYLTTNANNMQGLFYRSTDLYKFFSEATQYHPKHSAYKPLSSDNLLQQYILKNNQLLMLMKVKPSEEIKQANLPQSENNTPKKQTVQFEFSQADLIIDHGLARYEFNLPSDFPNYVSTGIFSDDISLITVTLGARLLTPTQGSITQPYSYDIRNFLTNKLTVALPLNFSTHLPLLVTYPFSPLPAITKILNYQPDHLTFSYTVQSDSWLQLNYPFDHKWVLNIDETPQILYKSETSFMSFQLPHGQHIVSLSYWPNIWLRPAIAVSLLLILVLPFGLIWYGIKDQ